MKKYLAAASVFIMLVGTAAARADVVLNETDAVYNPLGFTGTIASGATASADTIEFEMATFGVSMTINLTNSDGLVQDTIFSMGDSFEFDGINSGNATIGTTCVASATVACVVDNGGVLDLTSTVASLNGGMGVFDGFGAVNSDFNVQTDAISAVPEPSSLMLLGTGIAASFGMARRRFTRAA